jgi:hypothetical protein
MWVNFLFSILLLSWYQVGIKSFEFAFITVDTRRRATALLLLFYKRITRLKEMKIFFVLQHTKKILQMLIYKNIKNTVRNPKKLPECHRIGKRLKYPWISKKITKIPLVARVAHARSLLEVVKFFGEISGPRMVDYGRSEGEDSDDGGFDGRWWLMRENRRFEASGGRRNCGLFPARWGGENAENGRGLDL